MKENLLILDIDGVLNPFGFGDSAPVGFSELVLSEGSKVFLNIPVHSAFLETVSRSSEIVWGSAWEDEANLLCEHFYMDNFRHIPLSKEDVGLGTWKIRSIKNWVQENGENFKKIVWVDDELESDANDWAEERGDMMCVKTNPIKGLTIREFQKILNFLM